MPYMSVGEAAKELGANPVDITTLFYRRVLRDDLCPLIGNRRMIPPDYLEMIRMALKRAGRPVKEAVAHA